MLSFKFICGEKNNILVILEKVEQLAKEFVFNLEFEHLRDVLASKNIVEDELRRYFETLSLFIECSHRFDADYDLVIRAKYAHRFICDSYSEEELYRQRLINDYFLWLDESTVSLNSQT